MNEDRIYEVPNGNLAKLERDIAKLNKRAAKLGVPEIKLEVVEVEDRVINEKPEDEFAGFSTGKRVLRIHHLRVIGVTPKFAGWTFAATLAVTEAGNIIRKSPFVDREFAEWREVKPECEHCRAQRNRKDTFLVLHDDGTVKQIGRQCIRDFLGHQDPNTLASWAEMIFSAGELASSAEDNVGGISRDSLIHTETFLQHVAEWTLRKGFFTKKYADEQTMAGNPTEPTVGMAMKTMFPRVAKDFEWLRKIEWDVRSEAVELAEKAVELVLERLGPKPELSDFEHNLLVIAKTGAFEWRNAGIAAYLVAWYRKELELDIERKKSARAKEEATHFGDVAKRYRKQEATYVGESSFESVYGTTFIHKFDLGSSRLIWRTGSEMSLYPGDVVKITFTVKEHGEYKEWKQTSITRVVLDEVVSEATKEN